MQLIVGLETSTTLTFDREMTLTERYNMLTEEGWGPIDELLGPLLKKMYGAPSSSS